LIVLGDVNLFMTLKYYFFLNWFAKSMHVYERQIM